MKRNVLITGSNSGIGRLAALHLAQRNWRVAATMRDPQKAGTLNQTENIQIYKLDVTQRQSIEKAKANILKDFGHIDVVINNAGFGCYGAFELATEEQIDRQLAVNVKGLMMMCKLWLPHFRARQQGSFINISSIAGLASYPLASLYISSKWAVEGFTEALYYELKPFNISVKLIEPGGFKTNFQTSSITWTEDENVEAYDQWVKANRAVRDQKRPNLPDPSTVAKVISQAAEDASDRLRYLVGEDAIEMWAFRQKEGAQKYVQRSYQRFIEMKEKADEAS
ncbi:MAG: SDR family oxidoreductase [Bacteroidota bacterium]